LLDHYHYGIQGAVRSAGFLCERVDQSNFVGESWSGSEHASRGQRSEVVIGDLTGVNPNVCLEVGYARGCGVRTILVAPEARELPFDLRGQKILEYKSIKHLLGDGVMERPR